MGDCVETGALELRLKVPYDDEADFDARLGARAAEQGFRVPTEAQPSVGARVTLLLELRNGDALALEGVIDAHLRMDGRPGVNVRILRFPRGARGRAPSRGAPTARDGRAGLPAADEPLGDVLFADVSELVPDEPPAAFGTGTVSREIVEVVNRRAARVQRAAIALVVAALVVGVAGLAAARWLAPVRPEVASAAHVEASDRLLAEGRLTGKDGALEHLLAAKRLRPDDAATNGRLSRAADLLEGLAARALERGDVAVAKIHLDSAELAAPNRASLRAKREAIARRATAEGSSAPVQRHTADEGKRRGASR